MKILFFYFLLFYSNEIFAQELFNHGQPCLNTTECQSEQKTECLEVYDNSGTFCLCPRYSYFNGYECKINAGFGECSTDEDCTDHSICDDLSICSCLEDFHKVQERNPDVQIFLNQNKIVCRLNHMQNCTLNSDPSEPNCDLKNDMDCLILLDDPEEEEDYYCQCRQNYIWSEKRAKCVVKNRHSSCINDNSCVENAICTSNATHNYVCLCNEGFTEKDSDGTCSVKILDYRDTCMNNDPDSICRDQFICHNGICNCPLGSVYSEEKDLCRIHLDEYCSKEDWAEDSLAPKCTENAYCTEMEICACKEDYIPINKNTECGKLQFYCLSDFDCSNEEGQICSSVVEENYGICKCNAELNFIEYFGTPGKKCRVFAEAECELNQNCVDKSKCVEGTCKCEAGYLANTISHICESTVYEGDCKNGLYECRENLGLVCEILNEDLDISKCKCRPDWILSDNGSCTPKINGHCQDFNTCPQNSNCNEEHKCECNEDFSSIDYHTKCLKTFNKTCDLTQKCNFDLGLDCDFDTHTCQCLDDQEIFDTANGRCSSLPGTNCLKTGICSDNSLCINGLCVCNAFYQHNSITNLCEKSNSFILKANYFFIFITMLIFKMI